METERPSGDVCWYCWTLIPCVCQTEHRVARIKEFQPTFRSMVEMGAATREVATLLAAQRNGTTQWA